MCSTWSMRNTNYPLANMAASGKRAKNIEKQSEKTSINNTKIRKNRGVVHGKTMQQTF